MRIGFMARSLSRARPAGGAAFDQVRRERRTAIALGQQLPLPFLERNDDAGAFVDTGIVVLGVIVDAMRTYQFLGAEKLVAQRRAERRRAGRRGRERAL